MSLAWTLTKSEDPRFAMHFAATRSTGDRSNTVALT